jgi:hypothetical protein
MAASRDILLMFRQHGLSETEMQQKVEELNHLLFTAERLDNFIGAHEVFDINRYRIINNSTEIKKIIRRKRMNDAFIFFSNKN